MYKFLLLLLIVCSCTTQRAPLVDMTSRNLPTYLNGVWVNQELDKRPEFKGGENAMLSYMAKNTRYPREAQRTGVAGTALISAEVTEDGRLINEKIVEDPGSGIGEEALRVIQLIPDDWIPATLNGEPVKAIITLPVNFMIKNPEPQG